MDRIAINPDSHCWEWTGAKHYKGYGFISEGGRNTLAHRLSFKLHRGPIPHGMLVCHSCDNRCCVNPDHLFIGTNADNMADMVAKGRQQKVKGSDHGRARLTENDVIAVRESVGIRRRDLAKKLGVSRSTIDDIFLRRSWKHLGGRANG